MNGRTIIGTSVLYVALLAVDLGVAYGIAYLVSDAPSRVWTAVFVAAAFWVSLTYHAVKTIVVALLLKNEAGGRVIAKTLADQGFPAPEPYDTPDTYLNSIIDDESRPEKVRLLAATLVGQRSGIALGSFWRGLLNAAAWDHSLTLLRQRGSK